MQCKVLMFGWEFPPQFNGGLGIACYGLTKSLSKCKDVDVTFVLPKLMEVDKTVETYVFADSLSQITGTISITAINSLLKPYQTYDVYKDTRMDFLNNANGSNGGNHDTFGDTIMDEVYRYATKAAQIATLREFDIIHVHDWLAIPCGLEAKKAINKPLILHIHATEIDRTGGHVDQRIYDIERHGMEQADQIIAVSEHTRQTILNHYGIGADKVIVIHNGIDYDGFRAAPVNFETIQRLKNLQNQGYQIVLFVGRLTMQKGVEFMLHAAKEVIAHKPKTIFVIAGNGELQNQLIRLTASLKISKNVVFTGWIGGGERTSLYAIADLFIMPSISEPFGLVSLEAAAHDTPIIMSKTSGAKEILKNSIHVDYWNTYQTADMIYAVLEYQPLKTILTRLGAQEARVASWDKTAAELQQLYQQYL